MPSKLNTKAVEFSASKGRGLVPKEVAGTRSGILRACVDVSSRLSAILVSLQKDDEQDVISVVGAVEVDESEANFLVNDDAFFFFNALAFLRSFLD